MAQVVAHLSVDDLERGFRSARDLTAVRHYQVIWLLARGHTMADVAAVTSFVRRWIEPLLARYNAHGPELQPAERLWSVLDEPLANRRFASLAALDTTVARRCLAVDADRDTLKAHTHFHWWPKPTKPS